MAILADGTQACAENPITLTADLYGEVADGFAFEWSNGETSQTIQVTEGGEYAVSVTNEEGCRKTDFIPVDAGGCSGTDVRNGSFGSGWISGHHAGRNRRNATL